MAFVGVRASESVARSDYDYIGVGEKHKGQLSCNPILDWNSAELYIYIYSRELPINDCYKKGNSRAGCLVCPMVSEKNSFFRRTCYREEYDKFIEIIKELYKDKFTGDRLDEFLENTGWKARMNGRDVSIKIGCKEENLSKITEGEILTFESLFYEKNIKLKYDVKKNIKCFCNSDMIKELLGILIDNAIKHTKGKVIINLYKAGKDIVLEVKNDGEKIKKEDEKKIFERFYKVDQSRNRDSNRYGLGLAIAKEIVLKHNGTITASSKNEYTIFKVTLSQK